MNPRRFATTFLILAAAGLADAVYLTVSYYSGTSPVCSFLAGCDVVTTSAYAAIGPVPIALVGAVYYLLLLILGARYFDTQNNRLLLATTLITGAGALFSGWLFYLQAAVIEALCFYCLVSAAITILLFMLSLIHYERYPSQ